MNIPRERRINNFLMESPKKSPDVSRGYLTKQLFPVDVFYRVNV
jgi:hypothetical protein